MHMPPLRRLRSVILSIVTPLLSLMVTSASTLFAQIDRARDGPWPDAAKYYSETASAADQNQREAAGKSMQDMLKALDAVEEFTKDIPSLLSTSNLRELGGEAQEFLNAIKDFRGKASSLQQKLGTPDESLSSDLSAFRSGWDVVNAKYTVLWVDFQNTGKDIGGKYAALKATCTRGCLP
jgi:hypothetical protein